MVAGEGKANAAGHFGVVMKGARAAII